MSKEIISDKSLIDKFATDSEPVKEEIKEEVKEEIKVDEKTLTENIEDKPLSFTDQLKALKLKMEKLESENSSLKSEKKDLETLFKEKITPEVEKTKEEILAEKIDWDCEN